MGERLSGAALVGVTFNGALLPRTRDRAAVPLPPPALAALAALVTPVGDVGASLEAVARVWRSEPEELQAVVEELRARSLLVDSGHRDVDRPSAAVRSAGDVEGRLTLVTPQVIEPTSSGFRWHGADGTSHLDTSVAETILLLALRKPGTIDEAVERTEGLIPDDQFPDLDRRHQVVAGAVDLRIVRQVADLATPVALHGAGEQTRRSESEHVRELFTAARELVQPPPPGKVALLPISYPPHLIPLALGMILSYLRSHDSGALADRYDLSARWMTRVGNLEPTLDATGPAVLLCSNFLWSSAANLELSKKAKAYEPECITVHGGPDVPRYEAELADWMATHPHVDIAVRNEGEVTMAEILEALDGRLAGRDGDLSVLADVPGLTFRDRGRLVRTPDRARITDLDIVPSPHLNGVYDLWERVPFAPYAILETDRGCPYGCTFCDWGQSTVSRIRQFDLDRVLAEIEWVGEQKILRLALANANFGILGRDVDIARKVAEVSRETGFPREFTANFAKNTTKYLKEIVKTVADAGAVTSGTISIQTADPLTLDAVDRRNIRLDRYWELADLFRREQLPLTTDLMIGLPGATVASFRNDLQLCTDTGIQPKIYRTELLVNTPMNDPAYRHRWQIEVEEDRVQSQLNFKQIWQKRRLVVATSTYSRDDMGAMVALRDAFHILDSLGVARYLARYVRHESGLREIDFYQQLLDEATADTDLLPLTSWMLTTLLEHSAPPLCWPALYAELGRYVTEQLGIADDAALEVVLLAQQRLVPGRDRVFPDRIELDHDVVAWWNAIVDEQAIDPEGWWDRVPRLRTFGPGELIVEDPSDACNRMIGARIDADLADNWELSSPISRINPARHSIASLVGERRSGRSEGDGQARAS